VLGKGFIGCGAALFCASLLAFSLDHAHAQSLETRIDELDASAARKAPALSLKLAGQVNRVVMLWDDGFASDAFIADNIYSSSRTTLSGESQITAGLKSGFVIETEYREVGTSTLTAENDEGSAAINGDGLRTRLAYGWAEFDGLGRISIGQLAPATNSLVYYKLWTIIVHTSPDVLYNTAFEARTSAGKGSGLTWGALASALDRPRGDFLQYASPSFGGFAFAADIGEANAGDATITFDGAAGGFKLSAAAGFFRDSEVLNANDVSLSALIEHEPSGLYVHAAYAARDFDDDGRKTARMAWIHAGARLRPFDAGATTLFVEGALYEDFAAGRDFAAPLALAPSGATLSHSETSRWGGGIMQNFDAAGLEVYALYQHYEADVTVESPGGAREQAPLEPWDAVILGSRVKF
jgi:predicted porin